MPCLETASHAHKTPNWLQMPSARKKEMKKGREERGTEYAREEVGGKEGKVMEACGGRRT